MVTSPARVRTKTIGDELARLIKVGFSGLAVSQYGMVERLAAFPDLRNVLPGVFVKPEESPWQTQGMDISGVSYRVLEQYRICYAAKYDGNDDPLAAMDTAAHSILTALGTDVLLSAIAGTLGSDQVEESRPDGIEWFPPENVFFAEADSPVRVVVVRWVVQRLNRGS